MAEENGKNAAAQANRISGRMRSGGIRGAVNGGAREAAVVETETEKGVALPGVIEFGDTVHVARLGAPEQARVTAPKKPLTGVSCKL